MYNRMPDENDGGLPPSERHGEGAYKGVVLGAQPEDHVPTHAEKMFGDKPSGAQVMIAGEALRLHEADPSIPLDKIVNRLVQQAQRTEPRV